MNRRRVLVISHTYAAPVNRLKFDIAAEDPRFDLLLVTPRKWQNQITTANNACEDKQAKYRTMFVDVWFAGMPPLYLIPSLRSIIRSFKPDLIYCEQEPICLVALQTAMLAGRTPIVYFTWENIDRTDHRYRPLWLVRSYCLRRAVLMVAGSHGVASVIRCHGYVKPIYITPHLGVSEDLFFPGPEPPADQANRPFMIGFIGRFAAVKSVETLVEAVSLLASSVDWHLVLVGGGPEKQSYELAIRRLGLWPKVSFHLPLAHEGVPPIIRSLDVLVLPSRTMPTNKEQFGHVLIEAMACAVPVVGSSSGEIPNVIGDAGLIFQEGDAEDLRDKLEMLYYDRGLWGSLRQRGLERVKKQYTDRRIAANMITLFEIALGMECTTPNTLESDAATLPRISIVIPSYNQRGFLESALDSLARQAYPDLEVIVVDGGSNDGTVELLRSRSEIVTRWVSEPDRGQTHALNKGFDMAKGQVFGWLNCDERYRPGALRRVGEAFAQGPDLEIVFGHRVVVDLEGREIGRMKLPAIHPRNYGLYASGLLYSDTTFWRSNLHRLTGQLDEVNCSRYGMDFDWFCRLALHVTRWKRMDAYLSEFTEHENRVAWNVPEIPDIARQIRRRIQRLAGLGPMRIMLLSPIYFVLSRYGRFGWRGLLRPPSPISLLRVAGLVR
jgi:glycosyltransferase involved in cell wall biosynthesis